MASLTEEKDDVLWKIHDSCLGPVKRKALLQLRIFAHIWDSLSTWKKKKKHFVFINRIQKAFMSEINSIIVYLDRWYTRLNHSYSSEVFSMTQENQNFVIVNSFCFNCMLQHLLVCSERYKYCQHTISWLCCHSLSWAQRWWEIFAYPNTYNSHLFPSDFSKMVRNLSLPLWTPLFLWISMISEWLF